MRNNNLATKIFNALYDDDDLVELRKKGVIAQELGFKISSIATIECELDEEIKPNDDLATAFCQAMEMLLVDPINMTKEERREMHRKYVELEKVKHSLSEAK